MWRYQRPDAVDVLRDESVKKSLARYLAVMQNHGLAKFLIAQKVPATFNKDDSIEELWREHARLADEFGKIERELDHAQRNFKEMEVPRSFLDLKIEIARRILLSCHLCMRKCGVNRIVGKLGYCKCGQKIAVSSIFEHLGEEPELVPSGTIFTSGCTMKCKHCQNWTISQWMEQCKAYDPADLAN